jgi:hypothetical protein
VPEDKSKEIAASVVNHMKMAGNTYLQHIPVAVEVKITSNWQEKQWRLFRTILT